MELTASIECMSYHFKYMQILTQYQYYGKSLDKDFSPNLFAHMENKSNWLTWTCTLALNTINHFRSARLEAIQGKYEAHAKDITKWGIRYYSALHKYQL